MRKSTEVTLDDSVGPSDFVSEPTLNQQTITKRGTNHTQNRVEFKKNVEKIIIMLINV